MEVVALLLHKYEYGEVPHTAVAVAVPLLPPGQVTFVFEMEAVIDPVLVMVTEAVVVHKLASVTVAVNVPVLNPARSCVVGPDDHE